MSPISRASPDRRIASLDGLRAFSIALVFLGHAYATRNYPDNGLTRYLSGLSHLGVEIFFVISGFLITTLLVRERERTGKIDLISFYKRRTLRIFPAAFLYLTVIAVTVHPNYLVHAYTFMMCYVKDRPWIIGHLWSLSVEEQFYLLWPAAVVFGFVSRRKLGLLFLLIAPISRFLCVRAGLITEIEFYFPTVSDDLLMGCLLAMYRDTLRERLPWLTHPVVFAALGGSMLLVRQIQHHTRLDIVLGGLVPLVIALFIFSAVERADRFLNNPVTAFVGILSYSLYLWQEPFLNHHSNGWWAAFPVNLVLAIVCALGSYYMMERPFLMRSRRLSVQAVGEVQVVP